MARHLIFLVHGMGDTKPTWSQPVQEVIKTQYAGFHVSKLMPFAACFEFHEVNYNAAFDDVRAQWKKAAAPVAAGLAKGGLSAGAVKKLVAWSGEPAEDGFLNTHALDVVLYRFFGLVGQRVRDAVQKQLLCALLEQPANDVWRWSVIAHSLGTAVTHDVLHQMYSPARPPEWGVLPPQLTRPSVLMMLANVSRLLENQRVFGKNGDVYRSAVRPGAQSGACDYFVNVRHEFDPVPKPKMFRPVDDWPDLPSRAERRFINVQINAVEQANVHDFTHYLKNPRTMVPLFRLLTVPDLLPDDEAKAASDRYEASTPLEKYKREIRQLESLGLAEGERNWGKVLGMLHDFYTKVVAAA